MTNKTMGELISTLRKEQNMTQKELAQKLNVTDKAVSKWERNAACPDTATLPLLASVLGISAEDLLLAKAPSTKSRKSTHSFADLLFCVLPLAMGIAVVVTAALGELSTDHGFFLLGVGLAASGLGALRRHG